MRPIVADPPAAGVLIGHMALMYNAIWQHEPA